MRAILRGCKLFFGLLRAGGVVLRGEDEKGEKGCSLMRTGHRLGSNENKTRRKRGDEVARRGEDHPSSGEVPARWFLVPHLVHHSVRPKYLY
ncbi:hypothetical protein QVD17_28313 [Tagetes erecta]|uniref:Secreted protein n=1 Tax=Tagetes erecta TaxID=13708 RepID=A0AAD8KA77_TARER|nr:hypothetical protein QVD17_28313 [Tagetes erecta]